MQCTEFVMPNIGHVPKRKRILRVKLQEVSVLTVQRGRMRERAAHGNEDDRVGEHFRGQGSLANFAGGVLVLMFRPFRVGDYIDAQGVEGTVKEIQIFSTIINTGDNKTIVVPNGALSNGIITNYSMEATRRVDFVFGIGYDDDIAKAKAVLERLVGEDSRIHADPAHLIVVSELADSSVNFRMRVWVDAGDYSGVFYAMTENVKLAFDAENISIPFPQTDVHLHNQGSEQG